MLTHKTQHTEDCHICGKTVSASELISHGSTHVSILVCEICGWKGKQKSQLWEHMNGHLGCKPLKVIILIYKMQFFNSCVMC